MPFQITRSLSLPDHDVTWSFVRASGPGGQNVNKVATAVQLRFDLAGTEALQPDAKERLRSLAGRRVTGDGALLIVARNQRTQEGNRRGSGGWKRRLRGARPSSCGEESGGKSEQGAQREMPPVRPGGIS